MPKGSGSTSSQIAQTQKIRRKQIEKLKQQKLNVTIIHIDVQYKVDFPIKRDNVTVVYSIIIDLPPSFPSEPPVLFVHPPCSHKYLDAAQLVVTFPPLDNFKSKPDLASVVKKLISELEKNPPIPLIISEYAKQQQENILKSYTPQYPSLTDVSSTSLSEPTVTPSTSSSRSSDVPKLPDILPELEDLTVEELQELDTDEMQLLAFFHGTDLAKKIASEREEISQRIENIAKDNLSKSELLENRRATLVERYNECQKLKSQYDENLIKFSEACEWTTLPNLSLTLQVATAEQEEKGEKLIESFLEGKTDAADFTKEFVKVKKVAAIRKAQEDKISHILASQ